MRWLLVGDGESPHVRRIAAALGAHGIDVHLASFAFGDVDGERHLLRSRGPGDVRYGAAVPQLRRVVAAVEPDVVNAHYISSYGVMAALARPRRLIQTAWGSDLLVTASRPGHRQLASFALRRAQLVTGDSESLLRSSRSLAPRTPVHRFVFGPPAYVFTAPRTPEPLVLSVRNHEPLYRIDLILDAWRLASPQLPRHRLVVAGSGSLTATLRDRAPAGVEFVGLLPHDSLQQLLLRAAAVVSIPETDATSAAVLEAMAARCSVIASDLEANREWIPSTHLVPEPATASALADTLVQRLDAPLELDSMWSLERQIANLIEAVSRLDPRAPQGG
jgi:glycosyltransferase involved in cell wall biosynthesis